MERRYLKSEAIIFQRKDSFIMKKDLFYILAFAGGASVGSLVTWKVIQEKYRKYANEEIISVKTAFNQIKNAKEPDSEDIIEKEKEQYVNTVSSLGYKSTTKKKGGKKMKPYIKVISPDEYGEDVTYEFRTLTYYQDEVLTDEYDNIVDHINDTVGEESLDHFGEYEEDSVFVQNDNLKTYYEILLDTRNFADINPPD